MGNPESFEALIEEIMRGGELNDISPDTMMFLIEVTSLDQVEDCIDKWIEMELQQGHDRLEARLKAFRNTIDPLIAQLPARIQRQLIDEIEEVAQATGSVAGRREHVIHTGENLWFLFATAFIDKEADSASEKDSSQEEDSRQKARSQLHEEIRRHARDN